MSVDTVLGLYIYMSPRRRCEGEWVRGGMRPCGYMYYEGQALGNTGEDTREMG